MRLLILTLALLSVFFTHKSYSAINYDDLKSPKVDFVPCAAASFSPSYNSSTKVCSNNARQESCEKLAATLKGYTTGTGEYTYHEGGTCEDNASKIRQKITRRYSNGDTGLTSTTYSLYYANISGEPIESCPPDNAPLYFNPVILGDGSLMCAKDYDPYNNCPASSDQDIFTGGVGGGSSTKCFANPDGTQCKIETNEDGSYYLPVSYGSSEPEICRDAPYKPVDKTPDTPPKPPAEETDDTPESLDIDALNKINENLDAMNENQVNASESNDDLLDRIVDELQIGNGVLGQIRDQPITHTGLPFPVTETGGGTGGGTGTGEPCTGDDCDTTPTDDFTITGERKQGGLNNIFTDDDLAELEQEIEDKKTELTEYIDKIKRESKTIFEINTSVSGSYTEHKETIKGAEVDLGMGRFSGFFQIIAPALIFVSTVAALFIMLGGNKE